MLLVASPVGIIMIAITSLLSDKAILKEHSFINSLYMNIILKYPL